MPVCEFISQQIEAWPILIGLIVALLWNLMLMCRPMAGGQDRVRDELAVTVDQQDSCGQMKATGSSQRCSRYNRHTVC